jgi:hypothetical protein
VSHSRWRCPHVVCSGQLRRIRRPHMEGQTASCSLEHVMMFHDQLT